MAVTRPRNRLVFFRVSEDVFQKLTGMCQSGSELRSISELARFAVQRLIESAETGDERVLHHLQHLDDRLDDLNGNIKQITRLLESAAPVEERTGGNQRGPSEHD